MARDTTVEHPQNHYAVKLPMLRQWMRTHCGNEYEEPLPVSVDDDGNPCWHDDPIPRYRALASRPEFKDASMQLALKPYAALSPEEGQAAMNLINSPGVTASLNDIRRLTSPRRFRSASEFRPARTAKPGGEKDFGAIHRETVEYTEEADAWTVTVVNDTGDVYAESRRTGNVLLLGQVMADDGYTDADQRFSGREQFRNGLPLAWFAERCHRTE